jgi:hypothetical protein
MIPGGITYSHPRHWRSDLMVHLGPPILLADHIAAYQQNAASTLLRLSKIAYDAIELQVPNIADPGLNQVTVECTEVVMNEFSGDTNQWAQASRRRLGMEKAVYDKISRLDVKSKGELSGLASRYAGDLQRLKLEDRTMSSSFQFSGWHCLFLVLLSPLALTGFLLNALPVLVARRVSLAKVQRDDFFSWVFVVASTLLYLGWWFVVSLAAFLLSWKIGLLSLIVLPVTGIFTLYFLSLYYRFLQWSIIRRAKNRDPGFVTGLSRARAAILQALA